MSIKGSNWRAAAHIVNGMSAGDIREFLNTAARAECPDAEDSWIAEFGAYLEREFERRAARGIQKDKALLTVGKDLKRLAKKDDGDAGVYIKIIPLRLFVRAERVGLGLRDVLMPLCALRDEIAKRFRGNELAVALQLGVAVLEATFSADVDKMRFASVLRSDSHQLMQLALAIAFGHESAHNHSGEAIDPQLQALSPRLAKFRAALPSALEGLAGLLFSGLKYGEIRSLVRMFHCAHCIDELAARVLSGRITADIARELAQNADWMSAHAITLGTARAIMEWRKGRNLQFDFRATVTLVQSMEDVIAFPSGLETLLRYTSNPLVLRAAADTSRAHGLTLAWLVAGYRDCEHKIPFEKYVRAVQKFGERAKGLVRIGGENPEVFLEACSLIGINRARAIARRLQPADADTYLFLNSLQLKHPDVPLRAICRYCDRGFDEHLIAICVRAQKRHGVPHGWLAKIIPGAHTDETLALGYRFERELSRKPAAWESDLLAQADFLDETRRRGLKRALRESGEWRKRALESRANHGARNVTADGQHIESAPEAEALHIRRPRPSDPCELRLWVAWRIVRRMWAGRQFGAANVSPEDQRARNLPVDLIGLFDEAHAALIKDDVILTRGGMYIRASLNPARLDLVHTILNYEIPPNTALARWIKRASD